jgi:hypothetical protein
VPPKKRRTHAGKAPERADAAGAGAWRDRIAAIILAGVVGLVFRGGLSNGLVADDFSLINYCRLDGLASVLRVFDPVREVWYYRPLTRLVFGISYALFGMAAAPYHVVSLLAHAASVVLLYFVARRAGAAASASFAGALVFAVHYRQHESVFWFSAISYPVSTAFGLASALWFRASLAGRRPGLLAAAFAAAAAAMLTKDTAAVVPVLVALYGLLFAGEALASARPREKLLRLLPLACVLLAGVGLQAVPVEGRPFARGGAAFSPKGFGESLAFVQRSAALAVPGLDGLPDGPRRVAAWAAVAAFAAYVLFRRSRLALFGLAWAVLSHLPFYLFVPRMGDLYLYLPLAGVALVVSDAATLLASAASRRSLRLAAALGGAVFVLWSAAWIGDAALRWHAAGEVVGGVVDAVKAAEPSLAHGATLVLEGLPDRVEGVYAFQNAVPAVFWLAYSDRTLNVVRPQPGETRNDPEGPRFLYEGRRFYEVSVLGGRRLLRIFSGAD